MRSLLLASLLLAGCALTLQGKPTVSARDRALYHDQLASYGEWAYTAELGWSWSPSLVFLTPDYSGEGSDLWMWRWALHDGRWERRPHGWVWLPDPAWAPEAP